MSNEEEKKIDETVENIYRGLELTVTDLQSKLPEQVDSMNVKQLRRALKAVILYPEVPDDLADKMSEREQRFSASMLALHQSTVQLEIKAIGELQRDYHNKQQGEK
tara:strand:+ start:42 stop:359 length:318 start_codon:yes stop_codon:yes gene_type:complete